MSVKIDYRRELEKIRDRGRYRRISIYQPNGPVGGSFDGRDVVNFSGNDYLGFSHHQKVIKAAEDAVGAYGFGGTASRLICGNNPLYEELESKLARLKQAEASVVFSSGYQANIGVISALCDRDDIIFIDKLAHASLIDGCLISRARLMRYPHLDMEFLEKQLRQSLKYRRRFIVTDAVFSMDGDIAPLDRLVDISRKHDAVLIVDDAHGTGVLGEDGSGTASYFKVKGIDVQIGTLSKALGAVGGFVTGSRELVEFLINKARPLIFNTALPPAALAAAAASASLIDEEPERRLALRTNITHLRDSLKNHELAVGDDPTPIVPVIIGSDKEAKKTSEMLLDDGFLVQAIRPPAVPEGTARLRITVSALHERKDIDRLVEALSKIIVGLRARS